MLKFLGIGSCFSKEYENNSAFFIEGKTMFLIDCGGTVFKRLLQNNLLDNIENIYILITHFHLDHIGSLSDTIFYMHYIKGIKTDLIYPDIDKIRTFMNLTGVSDEKYNIVSDRQIEISVNDKKIFIEILNQKHTNTLNSYSYLIKHNEKIFYFSGDASEINQTIVSKWEKGDIDYIYHDCTTSELNTSHTYIDKLKEAFPNQNMRKNIICMHIDDKNDADIVEQEGFSVPIEI